MSGLQKAILHIALEVWVRYVLAAGFAWLLAYVIFKRRWLPRKVIQRFPTFSDVRREFGWSMLTALIYGLGGAGTYWLIKQGWTQMYRKIGDHSLLWFWSSVVIAIFIHDTYFYWTHRLMHHPRLFRWFHRVHHESTNPSPWAAYSFGPLEALVQVGIFPLLVLLIPVHPLAFGVFMIWQITFNVLGHTGFEYHPRWLMDSWLGKVVNTPTHHVQHHERLRGNYGLYFNLWDRLMGTNHRDYETRFREVTLRPPQTEPPTVAMPANEPLMAHAESPQKLFPQSQPAQNP